MKRTVGNYEILGEVRDGGALRGRHVETDALVELEEKPLPGMERDDIARTQRQLQLLRGLEHPNLVTLEDSFIDGSSCYVVTAERPARQLADVLVSGALFEHDALRIARDLALALQYLWDQKQLVHRDLKPEHVYLEVDGTARLSGFGIAKSGSDVDAGVTAVGIAVGTPQYMSPEQIRADVELDYRSDMYALGCLLYQILDGHPPFDDAAPMMVVIQQLDETAKPIRENNPEVSKETAGILARLLEKSRDDRFASWRELLEVLPAAPAAGIGGSRLGSGEVDAEEAAAPAALADNGSALSSEEFSECEDGPKQASDSVFPDRESVVDSYKAGHIDAAETLSREKYEIREAVAKGGMGQIELVRDRDLNRDVAMKTVLPKFSCAHEVIGSLLEEAQTVGQLEHPNIVPVYDVGRKGTGEIYFTMKYVEGQTLEAVIEKLKSGDRATHAAFSWARRVQIVQELCDALEFAHQRGVTHRDLKPANVMLGACGEVILMDWGLARIGESADSSVEVTDISPKEQEGTVAGTPFYMAPEQATGEQSKIGPRTDVFSVGALIYEFFSLQKPFQGNSAAAVMLKVTSEDPIPANEHSAAGQGAVPIEIHYLSKKAMSKVPEDRQQSAADLKADLQLYLDGKYPIVCPHTAVKRLATGFVRLIDNYPKLVIIGGIILLVIVFLLAVT